jgi:hypothetical protein
LPAACRSRKAIVALRTLDRDTFSMTLPSFAGHYECGVRRRRIAMPIASIASSVFWLVSIDQPIMCPEQASMTAAQHSFHSASGAR